MDQELDLKILEGNGRRQLGIYHLCISRLNTEPEMSDGLAVTSKKFLRGGHAVFL